MKMKVFTSFGYSFKELIEYGGHQVVHDRNQADLIMIEGGVDVNPEMYGQPSHPNTQYPNNRRDKVETEDALWAFENGIPVAGHCRGAQLLNILNGGSMYQDVNHHHGDHPLWSPDGTLLLKEMTSCHHQMMIPHESAVILGVSRGISTMRDLVDSNGHIHTSMGDHDDPEVLWYPKTQSFCIQSHPAWAIGDPEADYFWTTLETLLNHSVTKEVNM